MRWECKDYTFKDHSQPFFAGLETVNCHACNKEIKSDTNKDLCYKCYFGRRSFSKKGRSMSEYNQSNQQTNE